VQHETGLVRPRVKAVVVADKAPSAQDVAIAERLLKAHRAAVRCGPPPAGPDDLWAIIVAEQGRFLSILERGDPLELAACLCNVARHDASVGITQGDREFERITSDRAYRRFVALMTKDKLVSLAEAVGALPVENPEQGPFGTAICRSPSELVGRISASVGTDITPPDVDGGLLKIDTGRGLFGERDTNAIYTAHLLRQSVRDPGSARICEIGGGSGRVAYWSWRLGMTSYTLVDLPHVNVVQGYYALKSLPSEAVSLYGEAAPGTAGERLQILPAHVVEELRDPRFDLVLNQDSFPEMSAATVTEYLRWIRRSCHGSLMSINHESKSVYGDGLAHISVPELAAGVGGFELTYRFPYWLRRGYVIELYRIAR
jgi:hypothetical protein